MQKYDTLDSYWQDIHNIPMLSDEEEQHLAVCIQNDDQEALDKLVTANLRYVVSVARQYSLKSDDVCIDDLISEGNIALMMAAKKWNPAKEPRLISYAAASVKKAIEKCIAEQMDMLTLDAPAFPGQTNTLGDMQKAGKPMTDDGTEINETKDSLVYALRYLDDREKAVITHFYGINTNETMTMAEIGESLGLKRERVRQIRKTAERKIRKLMKK